MRSNAVCRSAASATNHCLTHILLTNLPDLLRFSNHNPSSTRVEKQRFKSYLTEKQRYNNSQKNISETNGLLKKSVFLHRQNDKRIGSSVWLEYMPVTHGVASSSLVRSAEKEEHSFLFFYCGNGCCRGEELFAPTTVGRDACASIL